MVAALLFYLNGLVRLNMYIILIFFAILINSACTIWYIC